MLVLNSLALFFMSLNKMGMGPIQNNQWLSWTMKQSIKQPINQTTQQSINESMNSSIRDLKHWFTPIHSNWINVSFLFEPSSSCDKQEKEDINPKPFFDPSKIPDKSCKSFAKMTFWIIESNDSSNCQPRSREMVQVVVWVGFRGVAQEGNECV